MNKKFYLLEKARQLEIINAGFEIFGKYDYKHASTDLIAKRAGMSKGLLFFYFKNKMTFYLFLFEYAVTAIRDSVEASSDKDSHDFFEVIEGSIKGKAVVLSQMPYAFKFMVMALHQKDERLKVVLNERFKASHLSSEKEMLSRINASKFREDISPEHILEMFGYLLDGYIQNKLANNAEIQLEEMMAQYELWSKLLKRAAYKPESD